MPLTKKSIDQIDSNPLNVSYKLSDILRGRNGMRWWRRNVPMIRTQLSRTAVREMQGVER
jgi:hypothetical protein